MFALIMLSMISNAVAGDEPTIALQQISENQQSGLLSEKVNEPVALVALAIKYENAEGRPHDYAKAADLYCRAAKSGNAEAQYALGWMYANGRGVTKNDDVAAQLFTLASNQGHAHAKEILRFIRPSSLTTNTAQLPTCLLPEKLIVKAEESQVLAEEDSATTIAPVYLKGPIFNLVQKLAPIYEIDPGLALAVISVESGFNVNAKSPKNAQGLMQLIPETAQRFKVKNAFDATENIKGGLAYLQWLLAFFKGDVSLVAAAYNAGEGAVQKYRGIPPFPETKDYVRKITHLYQKSTHPYKTNFVNTVAF
jgi:TPR repeat protein